MNQYFQAIWQQILQTLDHDLPDWPQRIKALGQIAACEKRQNGTNWSDAEVMQALIWGQLSSSTKWERVSPHLPELGNILFDYDIDIIQNQNENWISEEIYPWFTARKAGSTTLKASLNSLIPNSQKLVKLSQAFGNLENWLQSEFKQGGAKQIVRAIGSENSPTKLKGFGIPLAAEAAKNLGFSIAKPDRHLNRMMACWQAVSFKHWHNTSDFAAPEATESELWRVIDIVARCAEQIGESQVYVDNVLWLSAANEGLHLRNQDFAAMLSSAAN